MKQMSSEIVVAVYEDGTRFEIEASAWLGMNEHSEECTEALESMRRGDSVMTGGAQPLCRMWIDGDTARCAHCGSDGEGVQFACCVLVPAAEVAR